MFHYAQLLSKGKEQYSQHRKLSHELQNIKCKKTFHCMKRFSLWDLIPFSNFVSALLVVSRNAFHVTEPCAPSSLSTVKK